MQVSAQSKKILVGVVVVVLLVIVGVIAFIANKRSANTAEVSPTPQASAVATPSESPSPSLSPTTSPSPSAKTTPKPSPSPTPSPTPTPTFSVTAVVASVSPTSFTGACPKKFDFNGTVAANGPGTVTYKWVRSDGASGPVQTLIFSSAGSQAVSADDWTFGGSGSSYSGWEKVQILTPNSTESNQASFSLNCT